MESSSPTPTAQPEPARREALSSRAAPLHSQKNWDSNGQGLQMKTELSSQPRSFIGPVRKNRSSPPTEARVGPGVPGRGPFPPQDLAARWSREVRAGHRLRDLWEGNGWQGREPSTCSCTQLPAPAGFPVSSPGWGAPTSRPWRFFVCWFLDPHGPSCSSTFSRKASELPGQGCRVLRWDSPSDDQVALP